MCCVTVKNSLIICFTSLWDSVEASTRDCSSIKYWKITEQSKSRRRDCDPYGNIAIKQISRVRMLSKLKRYRVVWRIRKYVLMYLFMRRLHSFILRITTIITTTFYYLISKDLTVRTKSLKCFKSLGEMFRFLNDGMNSVWNINSI